MHLTILKLFVHSALKAVWNHTASLTSQVEMIHMQTTGKRKTCPICSPHQQLFCCWFLVLSLSFVLHLALRNFQSCINRQT